MNDKYLDKKLNKHLVRLQSKFALLDRKAEVKELNQDEKRYYGSWLNSQDETFYDSTNELKGELSFDSNTFEDGLETTSKNYE